jgi:Ca-activated chloride channel homolog
METVETKNETRYDYTLERWITFFLALLFLVPFVAQGAAEPPRAEPLPTTTLAEVENAGLLLKTGQPGVYAVAPTLNTEVDIRVTGPIVRTRVRQTFTNSTANCVEGLYVYPLPEMSSVDTLKMILGNRVIAGEIREREEAVREYQKAKSEGRKAALIEQHRPNVFATSVANLLPGEDAVIEIQYQETARYENGSYRLRFPMIVAPRYTPPSSPQDFVTVASRFRQSLPNVKMRVDLQPGHGVRAITSSHHRVAQQNIGQNHYQLTLDEHDIPQDRDFELVWQPDLGATPEATVLTEKRGEETYALVLVTPPAVSPVRVPREAIFIIDSSGSMEGTSMEQAREALLLALGELNPGDRFNVIDFDSEARALFDESQPADKDMVEKAKRFVADLDADGGTEMLKAIELALPGNRPLPGTVRQVIFMTDGQVGNEQQLFDYIHNNLGDSRLFTIGIGSAPNSHFMRNAARFGRGTFTYIGDLNQVKERMGDLFEKLGSPVMTSIDVVVDDRTAEVWPRRVPDLYRGEPLVVAIRLMDSRSPITLRGQIGNQTWSKQLTLPVPDAENGIAKLWARQKIEAAMDRLSEGASPAGVRTEVVTTALHHQLVSQYTSLVAVDRTPVAFAAPSCQVVVAAEQNTAGPDGALPQTATPGTLLLMAGLSLIALGLIVARLP